MGDIESALAASRQCHRAALADAISSGRHGTQPCAPGKWSPSQIVEHVARSFDASVNVAQGETSAFPNLPTMVHPLLRIVFRRIIKRGAFPNGRTTKAMNPAAGPLTPAEGRTRLMSAHEHFEAACRDPSARAAPIRTPMFGAVPVEHFVRFMEIHTDHHRQQMPRPQAA